MVEKYKININLIIYNWGMTGFSRGQGVPLHWGLHQLGASTNSNKMLHRLITVACTVGCIEKFFSSVSTNKGNRKLPFDTGFKNIIKFFKNVNVSCSHQRAEVTENRDFS